MRTVSRTRTAMAESRAASLVFACLGAATIAAYALFWLGPLWLGDFDAFSTSARSVVGILGPTWSGAGTFTVAFAVPSLFYVAALLLVPRVGNATAWRVGIAVAVLAPLTLLYTYPALAADVFDYLMIGRLLTAFHVNPYTHAAVFAPNDPYYPPVGWKALTSVYAPGFVFVSAGVTAIAGKSTLAALIMMKSVAIAAHWASAAVVYLIARRLNPRRALFAFVAYAWNPLVLVYIAVDGHNDSIQLLFILAAVYFALDRKWELSFVGLTLASLIKFVPLVLFPLFVWQARQDRRAVAIGLLLSVLVMAALFAPFWAGTATFDGVRDQGSRMTSSPAAVASFFVHDGWLRPISILLFDAGYLLILRKRMGIVQSSYAVLLLYLAVLSFWTKPWYFVWPIALGAILGGAAFWVAVPGMLGLFASNIFGGWAWQMNWLNWIGRWGLKAMELALTISTLGGWLLAAAVAWLLGRRRRPALWPRPVTPAAEAGLYGPPKTTA